MAILKELTRFACCALLEIVAGRASVGALCASLYLIGFVGGSGWLGVEGSKRTSGKASLIVEEEGGGAFGATLVVSSSAFRT